MLQSPLLSHEGLSLPSKKTLPQALLSENAPQPPGDFFSSMRKERFMPTPRVLMALALLLASILPARGQTQITTSVIQGEVVDVSGAVVPGVDVEVRNVDTNFTRSVVTDKDGRFVVL